MTTEIPVAVSGLVPGCPAANLAGKTLSHTGLKRKSQKRSLSLNKRTPKLRVYGIEFGGLTD